MANSSVAKTQETAKSEKVQEVALPKAKNTKTVKTTEKKVDVAVWDVVKYKDVTGVVTGIDKQHAKLYLDSPVCAWVDMADCRL